MEFWGIEVKPGKTVKVNPGDEYYLHISQAALGETMWNENVLTFLKHNGQKLVIGTLSANKYPQIQYDLVVEGEFELSHSSMNTSIYFCGYKTLTKEDDGEGFDDVFDHCESDEEEDIELAQKANGVPELKLKQKTPAQKAVLSDKPKPTSEEPKKDDRQNVESDEDEDEDDDEDLSGDDFDEDTTSDDDLDEDDEDVDSEDEDVDSKDEDVDSEDESDDEDEATPVKVEQSKKRPASASKTPVPEKKAKLVSLDNKKKGDSGKKKVAHTGTPHPAKQGGKGKAARQSPKSAGSSSKTFASVKSHAKAKHGGK